MEESQGSSSSLPPFLTKTYEMVDDPSTDSIVSWSASNTSFTVWNSPAFEKELLPRFFKHNNFSSFIRQLNTYGFRKTDPEQWEFTNDDFIRGQPHLMKNIHRRKPVHSHSVSNVHVQGLNTLTDSEQQRYKDDIERLKRENEALVLELQRREQEKQGYEVQFRALNEKLQCMDDRQLTMLSLVSQALQKPGLDLNSLSLQEGHERKRRVPRNCCLDDKTDDDGKASCPKENADKRSVSLFNVEQFEQLESSVAFWEDTVLDKGHGNLSLDFVESPNHARSPTISCEQLNIDSQPKSPVIDVNLEPAASVVTEQLSVNESTVATAPSTGGGVNDVFWEQFLTENPSANNPQGVQSGRKDVDDTDIDVKPFDHGKLWWNMRNANNLGEQMGHLTSVERT